MKSQNECEIIEIQISMQRFRNLIKFDSNFEDQFANFFLKKISSKLVNDKNILHDFMLWKFRDDLEYHKNNITMNIFSKTIWERKKSITEIIVMKINFSLTKKIVYIFCERITRN